jgi:hypothetical protein
LTNVPLRSTVAPGDGAYPGNLGQQEMEAAYLLVYDRALSAAEVEQNRQALKAILSARGISLP